MDSYKHNGDSKNNNATLSEIFEIEKKKKLRAKRLRAKKNAQRKLKLLKAKAKLHKQQASPKILCAQDITRNQIINQRITNRHEAAEANPKPYRILDAAMKKTFTPTGCVAIGAFAARGAKTPIRSIIKNAFDHHGVSDNYIHHRQRMMECLVDTPPLDEGIRNHYGRNYATIEANRRWLAGTRGLSRFDPVPEPMGSGRILRSDIQREWGSLV